MARSGIKWENGFVHQRWCILLSCAVLDHLALALQISLYFFLSFFFFDTSGSPVWWWYTVKREGRKERHRAQYGQGGKGAFWEWWQERVCMSTPISLWRRDDNESIFQSQLRGIFYERGVCIVIISIETRATARALLLRLHETADWGALLRWVRTTWHILGYIAKCGSSSCLKRPLFLLVLFVPL